MKTVMTHLGKEAKNVFQIVGILEKVEIGQIFPLLRKWQVCLHVHLAKAHSLRSQSSIYKPTCFWQPKENNGNHIDTTLGRIPDTLLNL